MAAADSIPGVSGSTVAFLMGFYDRFIFSINAVIGGSRGERRRGISFLGRLGAGWLTGIILCMVLLSGLFEMYIYQMSSAFMGLTLFAIPCVVYRERDTLKENCMYIAFALAGIGIVAALVYFTPVSATTLNCANPGTATLIYVFFSGTAAISAMVLPGISGSTLLLIFGVYIPILSSVKSLMSLQFQYLPTVLCFGAGIITGLVCITKGLSHCLKSRRSQMIYLILGLMAGSLLAIAMGPTSISNEYSPLSVSNFSWLSFALGGSLLMALELANQKSKSRVNLRARKQVGTEPPESQNTPATGRGQANEPL